MSTILFFIFLFTCTGVGKIFLQINPAVVAFIDILIAAWDGLRMMLKYMHLAARFCLYTPERKQVTPLP